VTDMKRTTSSTSGDAPARRTWEPMSLARIGRFEDVLRGVSGNEGETGGTMMGKT
jgi:hypothetical protein